MTNYKELIGLDIREAKKQLGYWWRCDQCQLIPPYGSYIFRREPGGFIELNTNTNVVTSEHHNSMADFILHRK